MRDWLMAAASSAVLAMAAHGLYCWGIAPGRSAIKFDRMHRVLTAKFTQHEDLKQPLLSTGQAGLVESAPVDNEVIVINHGSTPSLSTRRKISFARAMASGRNRRVS